MGQRLVMKIISDESAMVTVYYHWSAYSIAALYEAKKFLDAYKWQPSNMSTMARIISALESVGARVESEKCVNALRETFNYECNREDLNRNNGLIAYTDEMMTQHENYGEGFLDIYLDDEIVCSSCYMFLPEQSEDDDEPIHIDFNFEEISFDELNYAIGYFSNMCYCNKFLFEYENEVIELIE